MRNSLAQAGYTEVLTWALCSHDENYAFLRKPDDAQAVKVWVLPALQYGYCQHCLSPAQANPIAYALSVSC